MAIIGETGSGKTTLLQILSGLSDATAGEVFFEGKRVKGPGEVLIPGHSGISYLSQSVKLRNHYKVMDLLERHSIQPQQEDWVLAKLCRIDHLMERMTDALSGGERQRIGLAIELSKKPRLLLLDEPFSNLDIGHRNTLRSVLDGLHAAFGLSIVIVSHNPSEILGWADRILVLQQGSCLQVGKPEEIYHSPVNEYAAQLLGPYNVLTPAALNTICIIRPEKLSFTPLGSEYTHGIVEKIEFEGASYLYTVRTLNGKLLVRLKEEQASPGESVTIFVQ